MPRERWAPIPEFEGLYEASTFGNLRSLDRRVEYVSNGKLVGYEKAGRRLKLCANPGGYLFAILCKNGSRHVLMVHRLILLTFVGPPPLGTQACHNNGIQTDNRPENLRWDTPKANQRDRLMHSGHPNSKKTHCPYGHPYDEVNTYYGRNGGRWCRTCDRAKTAKRDARIRAERLAAKNGL